MTTTAAPKTLATEIPPQRAPTATSPVRREEPKDLASRNFAPEDCAPEDCAPRDCAPRDFTWAMRCVEREVYDLP